MFGLIFSKRKRVQVQNARKMLVEVNDFARSEAFYKDLSVADTMTGRFDLISLVASLVVIRLNQVASKESQSLVQVFFDVMFRQFDYSLRESGVGDLSVPKHMKRMMQGFHGRCFAYESIFVKSDANKLSHEESLGVLNRNLYSEALDVNDPALASCLDLVTALAEYVLTLDADDIMNGNLNLPAYETLLSEVKSAA